MKKELDKLFLLFHLVMEILKSKKVRVENMLDGQLHIKVINTVIKVLFHKIIMADLWFLKLLVNVIVILNKLYGVTISSSLTNVKHK